MSEAAPGSCLVVGVGPGLGSSVARAFAAAGHPVGLVGRDDQALAALARDLRAGGRTAAYAVAEASDEAALRSALEGLRAELGGVEILVYNAASYTDGTPSALPPGRLTGDYAVNVSGALTAVQQVLPDLLASGGTALLTGGGAAVYPSAASASLSLTKSGLRLLAQLLHEEMTPQGVHVITVTIQGGIGSRPHFAPERIAEAYLEIHQQPREEWKAELSYTD